ncbi:MAG: hypothetical protein O3C60_13040 [Planctomycetota bacterium]|nr:hypothetical protein [Planctomycetota bacterium]
MQKDPDAMSNDEPLRTKSPGTEPEPLVEYRLSVAQLAYALVRFVIVAVLLFGVVGLALPVMMHPRASEARPRSSQTEWTNRQTEIARALDLASQASQNTPAKDNAD